MRDWVTKALVQLLRGHLDVMRLLLVRFWEVDDPYVVQRVVVIAFGALMRSDEADRIAATELAETVQQLVFTPPMRRPDELLLDAARGIVEWAVAKEVLPSESLSAIKRPYGFPALGNPPKMEALEAKYGYKEDQKDDERYSQIFYSVTGMGDFGRYVIEFRCSLLQSFPHHEAVPRTHPQLRCAASVGEVEVEGSGAIVYGRAAEAVGWVRRVRRRIGPAWILQAQVSAPWRAHR